MYTNICEAQDIVFRDGFEPVTLVDSCNGESGQHVHRQWNGVEKANSVGEVRQCVADLRVDGLIT